MLAFFLTMLASLAGGRRGAAPGGRFGGLLGSWVLLVGLGVLGAACLLLARRERSMGLGDAAERGMRRGRFSYF